MWVGRGGERAVGAGGGRRGVVDGGLQREGGGGEQVGIWVLRGVLVVGGFLERGERVDHSGWSAERSNVHVCPTHKPTKHNKTTVTLNLTPHPPTTGAAAASTAKGPPSPPPATPPRQPPPRPAAALLPVRPGRAC